MRAREIKDLSIALEALSRINGYKFEALSDKIHNLLERLVIEAKEDQEPTPIKPNLHKDLSDEIPF